MIFLIVLSYSKVKGFKEKEEFLLVIFTKRTQLKNS